MTTMNFSSVSIQILDSDAAVIAHNCAVILALHFKVSLFRTVELKLYAIIAYLGFLLMNYPHPRYEFRLRKFLRLHLAGNQATKAVWGFPTTSTRYRADCQLSPLSGARYTSP